MISNIKVNKYYKTYCVRVSAKTHAYGYESYFIQRGAETTVLDYNWNK